MHATKKSVGAKTKALILGKALEMFREQGFEAATIRDIAKSAKVATGAAYYYFSEQRGHRRGLLRPRARDARSEDAGPPFSHERSSRTARDGDPSEARHFERRPEIPRGSCFATRENQTIPLSVFGKEQNGSAQQLRIFQEAVADVEVPDELRQLLPWALWMLHLGAILLFIYDESAGAAPHTRAGERRFGPRRAIPEVGGRAGGSTFFEPFQGKLLGV